MEYGYFYKYHTFLLCSIVLEGSMSFLAKKKKTKITKCQINEQQ
jgi:hypothetical protein